jgi:hypothetical protein
VAIFPVPRGAHNWFWYRSTTRFSRNFQEYSKEQGTYHITSIILSQTIQCDPQFNYFEVTIFFTVCVTNNRLPHVFELSTSTQKKMQAWTIVDSIILYFIDLLYPFPNIFPQNSVTPHSDNANKAIDLIAFLEQQSQYFFIRVTHNSLP